MTKQQRLVLIISILASFVPFVDGSVVNVALPAIMRDLGGGLSLQQWVVDAYLIAQGSLMLIAGSFSDIFGRKKVLMAGLLSFLVTSLFCALAPTGNLLIIARALQGVAGALIVPSSLALIMSTFSGPAQGKAIGSWTGWGAIGGVIGPVLGGILVQAGSWRLIFLVNVLPITISLWLLTKLVLPAQQPKTVKNDSSGALLCAIALASISYALIEQTHYGWGSSLVVTALSLGLVTFGAFIWREAHTKNPMLPLHLFASRNFWTGNLATVSIYGGLSVAVFLIVLFLQETAGYTAIEAGLVMLPVTVLMFFLSSRFGALAGRYGPRWFMTVGPLIAASGFLYLQRTGVRINYWSQLLPGILLFGLGLSITVAPLTSAILGAISTTQAGIASAVNNAVSRTAGLLAVASIGLVTGPHIGLASFHRGVRVIALLLIIGGLISAFGIRTAKTTKA